MIPHIYPFRRFRVFISYAREQKAVAELLAHTLEREGREVFFDQHDLPPGEAYTSRIRAAIHRADLFVFLISPESVAPGTFALTELGMAVEKWGPDESRVLGVMVRETPPDAIPPSLRATTWLVPQGDGVAETANAVARLRGRFLRRGLAFVGVASAALALAVIGVYTAFIRQDCAATGLIAPSVTAGAVPEAGPGAPSRDEAVSFHLSEARRYLLMRPWVARAEAYADSNRLQLVDHWLVGAGVTHDPRNPQSGVPISPERAMFGHTGPGRSGNAAHLLIHEDGSVTQFAPFNRSTLSTEKSDTTVVGQMVKPSVGIHLVNRGEVRKTDGEFPDGVRPESVVAAFDRNQRLAYWEVYTEPQLFRALQIAWHLKTVYKLTDLLGHYNAPPVMEMDPGPAFALPLISATVFDQHELRPAAESYARALALDPPNVEARKGFEEVVDRFAALAEDELAKTNGGDAAYYIDSLAKVAPCDPRVDGLRRRLRASRVQ